MKLVKSTKVKGPMKRTVIKEELETELKGSKNNIRLDIHNNVFDINDSVADNSKFLMILFGMLEKMYSLPNIQNEMSEIDKEFFDIVLNKFNSTNTLVDKSDFMKQIEKLFNRQNHISKIVKDNYNK